VFLEFDCARSGAAAHRGTAAALDWPFVLAARGPATAACRPRAECGRLTGTGRNVLWLQWGSGRASRQARAAEDCGRAGIMAGAREGTTANQNRRVKVYVLGSDGQWDDRGTGYVNCELIAEHDALGLRVLSEQDANKELLVTKIFEEEVFQRQGDTIVTWTNPETREDVALSFQEAAGAQEVWEMICQVQGRSPLDDGGDDGGGGGQIADSADLKLPQPEMDSLQQLQDIVMNATSATRDRIVDGVMADGYLAKLLAIFRDCEDLEMTSLPLSLSPLSSPPLSLSVSHTLPLSLPLSRFQIFAPPCERQTAGSRCCTAAESRALANGEPPSPELSCVATSHMHLCVCVCVCERDALTGAPLCVCVVVRNSLHTLFRIFKGLIMLNEPSLIEACLSDAFFLDTMGYFFGTLNPKP
jgi:hypothetical protein